MRVGLSIETDSPGGAETMLIQLTRALFDRGHEVVAFGVTGTSHDTYFADGDTGWLTARFAELGVRRELVEVRGPFGLGSVPQIAAAIRDHRLDVLHSHEFSMAVVGSLAAKLTGRPHLITMHGGTYYASAWRRRAAMRLATRLSRHTIAVSEAARQSFTDALGLRSGSTKVVHNGVATFRGSAGKVRKELGLQDDDVLALAVGSLLPVKGHSILLDALSGVLQEESRLVVAIAGQGAEEASLRGLAAELEVADRVHFLGYRSDIPDLLEDADIYVMPSLSEGLPMAMIEGMLAGKAVLASDVGGVKELVPTADVGLLVPPANAGLLAAGLRRLADDPKLRERLGNAARRRAHEHFTATAMADRYLALYER